jgi:oligopeptide/dipeptide ABC transporter ATP-binding protein
LREVACFHPLAGDEAVDTGPQPLAARAAVVSSEQVGADVGAATVEARPLIEARELSKSYSIGRGLFSPRLSLRALDHVSLQITPGETLGLVGESGCGKSTLGRVLLQLERQTSGEVAYRGQVIGRLYGREHKRIRRELQMIFQDPYGSIDPRWRVHDVVAEPLVSQGGLARRALEDRVGELLELVGLPAATRHRYAYELSGGQRQRVGIARAIAPNPRFIVADEAVSALDLSVQAQVINLLADLRERLQLTTLFIGHGLSVVRHLSDRIGVMYLGRLVELAPADELFQHPAHHYTAALLAAMPQPDPTMRREFHAPSGELPSPTTPPSGCHFHPRCPAASDRCKTEAPKLHPRSLLHSVACHHPR